jgi:hypothetical protein
MSQLESRWSRTLPCPLRSSLSLEALTFLLALLGGVCVGRVTVSAEGELSCQASPSAI